jgi:DNA-binding HxlR family transcriptional regulator
MGKENFMSSIVSPDCAVRLRAIDDTMDILSGKWKIPILARLQYTTMRYSELLKDLAGISGKMLSRELFELEVNGLVTREVINSKPLVVNYHVTEYGMAFKSLMDHLADWGVEHRDRIIRK